MNSKTQTSAGAASFPVGETLPGAWSTPPGTMEEHIQRIERLGKRIDSYIQFMCQVGSMQGTSIETKQKAVTAFHECLVAVEAQLGRIHDALRLD